MLIDTKQNDTKQIAEQLFSRPHLPAADKALHPNKGCTICCSFSRYTRLPSAATAIQDSHLTVHTSTRNGRACMSQITACSAATTKAPARQARNKVQGLAQNTAQNCWYSPNTAHCTSVAALSNKNPQALPWAIHCMQGCTSFSCEHSSSALMGAASPYSHLRTVAQSASCGTSPSEVTPSSCGTA